MDNTVAAALRDAAQRLMPVTDAARLEAEWLMAHALDCSRSDLLLRHMQAEAPAAFAALVERRACGEPLAHITGETEFYGLSLKVTPDVLIPRSDTEILIDVAQDMLASHAPARVLDCGLGSGALLLAALSVWPDAEGAGIERSGAALAVARANAGLTGLAARADMRAGDWTQAGWSDGLGRFDLVLSNPPYVETGDPDLAADVAASDPHAALFAGLDGLDDYRVLIPALPDLLQPKGIAVFEIGSRQADAVIAIAREAGLWAEARDDLAGRPRVVVMGIAGG
ncbi:peptide chain release factor N(5)-glutamine methyltransferase [Croceicoccus mobilis]|uniref:Release factor glutamine methyltransferase n=1 Tax=Croceicoccus mobilis TaxID=1703339 RepID=A0A916Z1J7_9SPHN|nr:peptide chain release factor N(5)-glutamine methyltransferase [Croceicoccus mobilis]GGD71500.1 release factor glutamine methyltransferase [Croceicoccus mobilis]